MTQKKLIAQKRKLIRIFEKRGDSFSLDLARGHRRDIKRMMAHKKKRFVKGSKEAKAFMKRLRGMKGKKGRKKYPGGIFYFIRIGYSYAGILKEVRKKEGKYEDNCAG